MTVPRDHTKRDSRNRFVPQPSAPFFLRAASRRSPTDLGCIATKKPGALALATFPLLESRSVSIDKNYEKYRITPPYKTIKKYIGDLSGEVNDFDRKQKDLINCLFKKNISNLIKNIPNDVIELIVKFNKDLTSVKLIKISLIICRNIGPESKPFYIKTTKKGRRLRSGWKDPDIVSIQYAPEQKKSIQRQKCIERHMQEYGEILNNYSGRFKECGKKLKESMDLAKMILSGGPENYASQVDHDCAIL